MAALARAQIAHHSPFPNLSVRPPWPQESFALHPKLMPGVDFTKMMTEDGMHLEADGLLQCESHAHRCFVSLSRLVSRLVSRLASYPATYPSSYPSHTHLPGGALSYEGSLRPSRVTP